MQRVGFGTLVTAALTAVVAVAILAGPAAAQGDAAAAEGEPTVTVKLMEGGLTFHAAYHSNPYYRDEAREDAGIVFNVSPSVKIDAPINDLTYLGLHAQLGYTAVLLEDEDVDENKDSLHPLVKATLKRSLGEYSALSLSDLYQTENVGNDLTADKYFLNQASVGLDHDFGERVSGGLWYKNVLLEEDSNSTLFDFVENSGGATLSCVLGRSASGRDVTLGLHGSVGHRDFEDHDAPFTGQTTPDNPKTHTFYRGGASLACPLAQSVTLDLQGGWVRREYEVGEADSVADRDEETDSATGAASLTLVPGGGPLSFTLAASYAVTDTLVVNVSESQSRVFDTMDPLLNNLERTYREQEVTRTGISSKYRFTDTLVGGFSCVYQKTTADAEEDLGPISGQSGISAAELDEDRLTLGVRIDSRVHERVRVGLSYLHGIAEDDGEDLYEYDSVGATVRFDI